MSRTRISRGLVALVLVVIVLGAVAYFRNPTHSKAGDGKKDPNTNTPVQVAVVTPTQSPQTQPPKSTDVVTPIKTSQINIGGAATRAVITQTPGTVTQLPKPEDTARKVDTATPRTSETPKKEEKPAPTPRASGNALADGKAQIEAGNLLQGRQILNDALIAGLAGADAATAKQLIAKANETLVFSPRRTTGDPLVAAYTVQSGDKPTRIAQQFEVTWDFLGRINNIPDARRLRAGSTLKGIKGPFHAVVSKSTFIMDIYAGTPGEKGSMYIRSFKVGLGKHGSTPTGSWMVTPQNKLKNPKWWGTADEPAKEADDPANPLGEFWIGLTGIGGDAEGKVGFGVHGTIEADSIGKEQSHGCIRLVNSDVERIYEMLVEGKSTVTVKD